MSALLGHIKALRTLADSYQAEFHLLPEAHPMRPNCLVESSVARRAADVLEQQMREECGKPS